MQQRLNIPEEEINLLDYWRVLASHKKTVASITAAAAVISVIVSLLLPKVYAAKASVMPPQQDDTIAATIASNAPGGLGGLASGILGAKSPADLWVGILKSRNVRDEIVQRFGLKDGYGKDTVEETLKALDKRVDIEKSVEDIVSVTVEDEDPDMAAKMANAFIEELDRINKGAVMTSGQRMRAFIEKRLKEARAELSRIEEELKDFKERNKAVKLDDQSKAIIEAVGALKGTLMAREVELETFLSYAAPTNPQVSLLKTEINGLKEKLKELGAGSDKGNPRGRDIFIPTDRIPGLSFEYARLLRDAKIQETLFELLTQQYEMARIQEAKDSPTVQVLDVARPPDKKIKPRRALIVAASIAAAFLFSVFLAFFLEYLERIRRGGSYA